MPIRSTLIVVCLSVLSGQSLSVVSDLDTTSGFIGDVIVWSVTVENAGNQKIRYPDLDLDNDSISIREQSLIHENGRLAGVQFELMFWDTGRYQTPEYQVEVVNTSGDIEFSLQVPPLDIQIETILSSEEETALRPLQGPVPVRGILPLKSILSCILIMGLITGMVWTWKQRQPVQYSKVDYTTMETPLERARRRLNELNSSGFSKEFYTGLSHISREYIETKYFVRALEMTTNEIAENRDLFPLNDEQFETWIRILHSSDMVKYARETSNTDQIISDLTDVRSIISDV